MNDSQAETKIKEILFNNLPTEGYRVFMFGSRAEGKNRRWSDFDIGILGEQEIKVQILHKIESEFEESDIPYKVDVVDFSKVSDNFKKVALTNIKEWKIKK